jgi:hypothetical protein
MVNVILRGLYERAPHRIFLYDVRVDERSESVVHA